MATKKANTKKKSFLVSVIIVSYNTRKLTIKSIKHVYASRGVKKSDLEVIVVDNNSSDDTVSHIKKTYPSVKLVANRSNKGFGGGNNQGVKLANGKYILLLNTDAYLSPDSLRTLIDVMDNDNSVVSVGPRLVYENGDTQLSGGYLPTLPRVFFWMFWLDRLPIIKNLVHPYHVHDLSWHTKPQEPEWLMGACVLFRRKEFTKAGGFDDNIFMYAEEVELYRRLRESLGKRVVFTPATTVVHVGSASTKKANAFRLVHELRGVEYIYKKHYPVLLPIVQLILYLGALLRLIIYRFIPGRRDAFEEYKKFFQMA